MLLVSGKGVFMDVQSNFSWVTGRGLKSAELRSHCGRFLETGTFGESFKRSAVSDEVSLQDYRIAAASMLAASAVDDKPGIDTDPRCGRVALSPAALAQSGMIGYEAGLETDDHSKTTTFWQHAEDGSGQRLLMLRANPEGFSLVEGQLSGDQWQLRGHRRTSKESYQEVGGWLVS